MVTNTQKLNRRAMIARVQVLEVTVHLRECFIYEQRTERTERLQALDGSHLVRD